MTKSRRWTIGLLTLSLPCAAYVFLRSEQGVNTMASLIEAQPWLGSVSRSLGYGPAEGLDGEVQQANAQGRARRGSLLTSEQMELIRQQVRADYARQHESAAREAVEEPVAAGGKFDSEELSSPERKVLVVYDHIASVMQQEALTCGELGEAVEKLVVTNRDVLRAHAAERIQMGVDAEEDAERLDQAAGDGIDDIRKGLQSGLARCGSNERLRAAIRALALSSNS